MGIGKLLSIQVIAAGALCFCAAGPAQAAVIDATYSFNANAIGDPANPPLMGIGTGVVTPVGLLGNMNWADVSFPDLTTGANHGTFTMTFTNGDTLFGTLQEQIDLTSVPNPTFTQSLTITGGTGALRFFSGTLNGNGVLHLADSTFSVSGAGTLNTTPEPGSVALLLSGLLSLGLRRRWQGRIARS